MNTHITLFFITLPLYILIDIFWLSIVMRNFYRTQLKYIARMSEGYLRPDFFVMFLAYVVISVGVVCFAVMPCVGNPIALKTFGWGALYGFVGYGIYELTNYAVLKDWPANIVFVDVAWGAVVNGIVTVLVVAVAQYFRIG